MIGQHQLKADVKNAIVDCLKAFDEDVPVTCNYIFGHLHDKTDVYTGTNIENRPMSYGEAKEFTVICIKEMANAGYLKLEYINSYSLRGF